MKIAIDMDGTMVDFLGGLTTALKKRGYTPTIKPSYDLQDRYEPRSYLFLQAVNTILVRPSFWNSLKPYPDAIETIRELQKKHKIMILSKLWEYNKNNCELGKKWWLERWLKDIPYRYVFDGKKRDDIDMYIEDWPPSINATPDNLIIMDQDYNKDFPGTRVKDWKEIESRWMRLF